MRHQTFHPSRFPPARLPLPGWSIPARLLRERERERGVSLGFPAFPPFHGGWKSWGVLPLQAKEEGMDTARSLFNPNLASRSKCGIKKQPEDPNSAFPGSPSLLPPLEGGAGYVQTQPEQNRRAQGWGWDLRSSPYRWGGQERLCRIPGTRGQGASPPCPVLSEFGLL